jgi:AAA15 family ATPase/GTPase
LQPLNVLIGPNGSGKSNLIEAFGILKATPTDIMEPIRKGNAIMFSTKTSKALL